VKLTLAAAICWENYMPLLRHSLYSQNVNLYLAPTADARDMWLSLMRTVACEGRCFVLSANQCVKKKDLPKWIHGERAEDDFVDGEERKPKPARRTSVITEFGHEIALPTDHKDDLEEAIISGEQTPVDKEHRRKSSVVTEHGHEIILPAVGDKPSLRETISAMEDAVPSTGHAGKGSCVTKEGHEIIFPMSPGKDNSARRIDGDEDTSSRRRSRTTSFRTEHGHEIIFPTDCSKSKFGKTANGQSPKKTKATESKADSSEFACRGGSCIISPSGDVIAGPLWGEENELLIVDVDFDDCLRGRLDLDVAGSYSRFVIPLNRGYCC
jgi:nitrilase